LPAVHLGRPLTAVALLALTASVGCSGNPDSAAPTERGTSAVPATVRSTLSTASTTSGTSGAPGTSTGSVGAGFSAEQQAVIDAHGQDMGAYHRAAAASTPNDPVFKNSFSIPFLKELQIRIQQRADNGHAVRDAQPSNARTEFVAVDVQVPTATLTTCEVDDRVVYRTADGSAVNAKVSTARWSVAMTYEDGVWKIAGRQQVQTWDGEEMEACLAEPRS
jgi:hypothetical protein